MSNYRETREDSPFWDVAWDEAYHRQDERAETWAGSFAYGAEWGAGWLAAIIGMAAAIRANAPRWCPLHKHQVDGGPCDRCVVGADVECEECAGYGFYSTSDDPNVEYECDICKGTGAVASSPIRSTTT